MTPTWACGNPHMGMWHMGIYMTSTWACGMLIRRVGEIQSYACVTLAKFTFSENMKWQTIADYSAQFHESLYTQN